MKHNEITIAIVGHTNTGKTSLIRALTQQRNFGEVKNAPATTINLSEIKLSSTSFTFKFIDTPGLEDSMGILELLPIDQTSKTAEKQQLLTIMKDSENQIHFDQEFKVLHQMFQSDMAFFVVDVRQPFLPRYHYEILLLLKTHIPLLPILNFTQNAAYLDDWKRELKACGLHHYLEFDTILLPRKQRLYEQIAIIFPELYDNIQSFIQMQNSVDLKKENDAMLMLAEFYIDLMTLKIKANNDADMSDISHLLTQATSAIEEQFIHDLLSLYQFNKEDIVYVKIDDASTAVNQNLLTMDELGRFSIHFTKGAVAGATVLAGVDLASGFMTLGAASATGAVVGGVFNSIWNYGERVWNKFQNIEYFFLDQQSITLLTLRLLYIIKRLNDRSHADLAPITMMETNPKNIPQLTDFMKKTEYLRGYDYLHLKKNDPKKEKLKEKIVQEIDSLQSQ